MTRPTFAQAQARYPHRYTLDHVPQWAREPRGDGTFYAPQYASDWEWYQSTVFPGEPEHHGCGSDCYSRRPTFPYGRSLKGPL